MGKQTKEEETTALAVPGAEGLDLFSAGAAPAFSPEDAGLGSEDIGSRDVVLPRFSLLQPMSKIVTGGEHEKAEPGAYWLFPHNRPLTVKAGKGEFTPVKFVVVRIYPTQRRWTPLEDGGGLECEAPAGDYIAREANGLAGAAIQLTTSADGEVTAVAWEGGTPTNICNRCVYGPGAAAAAAGKEPSAKGGNPWLPKIVQAGGKSIRVPDKLRAPRCTQGLDALVILAVPPFDELPPEAMPAFFSFARTAMGAGRALAGMIKLKPKEPAWSMLFELGMKRVSNESGTWFIPTVRPVAHTNAALAAQCRELYESTKEKDYRPSMDETDDLSGGNDVVDAKDLAPGVATVSDDAPLATDQF